MNNHSEEYALTANSLSKRFGSVQAVSDLSVNVAPGEALGLLGPNGAGKSTTLSMLMGLQKPDAGEALVFGNAAGSPKARMLCGTTPQATDFPDQLSPRELLSYAAARYDIELNTDHVIKRFGLEAYADRRTAGFSGGELRRLAVAMAFVGNPKLVFLDEPTVGLDTAAQERFREHTLEYIRNGGAVVLTSHQWDEIEAICDTIVLIDTGEVVVKGGIDDMRTYSKGNLISFELPDGTQPPDWLQAHNKDRVWYAETNDSDAALRKLVDNQTPFQQLSIRPLTLPELIERVRKGGIN